MIYMWLMRRQQQIINNFTELLITYSIVATLWIVSWLYGHGWDIGTLTASGFLVNMLRYRIRSARHRFRAWRARRNAAGSLGEGAQPST